MLCALLRGTEEVIVVPNVTKYKIIKCCAFSVCIQFVVLRTINFQWKYIIHFGSIASAHESDNYLTIDEQLRAEQNQQLANRNQYERDRNEWANEDRTLRTQTTTLILDIAKLEKTCADLKQNFATLTCERTRLRAEKETLVAQKLALNEKYSQMTKVMQKKSQMTKVMQYLQDKHRNNKTKIAKLLAKNNKLRRYISHQNQKCNKILNEVSSDSNQ